MLRDLRCALSMTTRPPANTSISPQPPVLPKHSPYAVQTYSKAERAVLATPNHFFFPSRQSNILHILSDTQVRGSPLRPIDNLRGLRVDNHLLSFNIYPTCRHSLAINSLLYDAARTGSFDSARAHHTLGVEILSIGIAPELHQFLSITPKPEIDLAIIDFLVLLHHQHWTEGDDEGVRRLEEDLEPSVYAKLRAGIGIFPTAEPPPGRRALVLEQLVQLAFLTPWRVDVWGAYLTNTDVQELQSGLIVYGDTAPAKMVKDWIKYAEMLHSVAPDWGIADGLERAIGSGKSVPIFTRALAVVRLCVDKKSLFTLLPREVVEGSIIPLLVKKECESLRSRRRRVAGLDCLLTGGKFLDELELGGEDVITRLAAGADGLSVWREWAHDHGVEFAQEAEMTQPLDMLPWGLINEEGDSLESSDDDMSVLDSSEIGPHGKETVA